MRRRSEPQGQTVSASRHGDLRFGVGAAGSDGDIRCLDRGPAWSITELTPVAETTAAFEDGDARPYVLYVGSRSAYKNFPALMQAFGKAEAARSMRLVVAGGGRGAMPSARRWRRTALESRVLLLPRVEEAHLGALYRGAALFVYPSLYEGFGLPPLEAMSAGCPVLVSRTSSFRRFAAMPPITSTRQRKERWSRNWSGCLAIPRCWREGPCRSRMGGTIHLGVGCRGDARGLSRGSGSSPETGSETGPVSGAFG